MSKGTFFLGVQSTSHESTAASAKLWLSSCCATDLAKQSDCPNLRKVLKLAVMKPTEPMSTY